MTRRRPPRPAVLATLLAVAAVAACSIVAGAERPLADPVDAFVNGYDPSGGDFFVHAPERTVLLRLRTDFNNDGIVDLALSEGSIWGQAGGPWLIFLGDRGGRYTYVGELFFHPARLAIRPVGRGAADITAFVRDSAASGHLVVSRVASAGISPVRDQVLRDVAGADQDAYRAAFSTATVQAESCRLVDYRGDKLHCWRAGVRLE